MIRDVSKTLKKRREGTVNVSTKSEAFFGVLQLINKGNEILTTINLAQVI